MKAVIRYFTGTGNTRHAMDLIAQELKAAAWEVDCQEYFDAKESSATDGQSVVPDLFLVAAPALGMDIPAAFRRWLGKLPHLPAGQVGKAAVVVVCGAAVPKGRIIDGYSGWGNAAMTGILRRRGWEIVGSWQLSYPENWTQVLNPPDAKASQTVFDQADPQARQIGKALASGQGTRLRRSVPALLVTGAVAWLFRIIARRFIGKLYVADGQCNGCAWCARTCPARAIKMVKERPHWNLDCSACNRCINVCPQRSIQTSVVRLVVHAVLNVAALVFAIAAAQWPLMTFGLIGSGGTIPGLPPAAAAPLSAVASIISALLIYLAISLVQLGPVETLLAALARTKWGARFLAFSWTSRFRRYRAPNFNPRPFSS